MKIKVTAILVFFTVVCSTGSASAGQLREPGAGCKNDSVLSEKDTEPEYNLLSIPAREVNDPYILAVSYFNSVMNVILRENVVSEFSYSGVPYYIYKSFINAESKESYWKNCIKDIYDYEIIY